MFTSRLRVWGNSGLGEVFMKGGKVSVNEQKPKYLPSPQTEFQSLLLLCQNISLQVQLTCYL